MDATLDLRTEIREFLRSRRARITPEKAGLPAYGGNRRVKGLKGLVADNLALLASWAASEDTLVTEREKE